MKIIKVVPQRNRLEGTPLLRQNKLLKKIIHYNTMTAMICFNVVVIYSVININYTIMTGLKNYISLCAIQYNFSKIISNKTSDNFTDANLSITLFCNLSLRSGLDGLL